MRLHTGIRVAAVVAATALLATACSGTDDGGSGDGGGDGGKVELTFWTWAPGMEEAAAVWNEANPDIQVTVNKQDGGDPAVTKLLTAIKAGSGAPDLFQTEYQKIPTLVSSDALADIADVLPEGTAERFADGTWQSVTLGSDAVYGVPQDSGPMEFYYREDIFQQYGLAVPTTWEQYAQVAEQLHAADPTKYLGTFSANDAGWFTGLTQQAGASWWGIDGDAWTVDIEDAPVQKVAEYWGGLVEKGVIDNKPMYTPEWNAALNDGTQVGWISAIWAPGVLEGNAPDTAGTWKMAPMPQWEEGDAATGNWGGSATSVTSQSTHKEEAAKFIAWLNASQEGVNLLVSEGGLYPADIPSQAEALSAPPAFFSNQPDFYTIASEIAGSVQPFTYGPNVNVAYSAYNDEFGKATEAKSAAAFLDAVTAMQTATVEDLESSGFTVKE
ncbi:ABC transporter substrate-binding protein [Cellulomonas fimi]|uniref:Extracellular solute-binding protein family 1 n=1 Tax=Cellulomonas fimi (strain ATCC 484 / DSM 20113 / JCM 1341 / CCUG 24087 / LMG 16345 / NBRC 15513 / NCIMB 8980 / NCTC 7547 / NRS-133) TaxID=590998 RepID=F4H8B0_CELFA|nr:extracellular solute-binding protein [Cellulomonas fimi]AEE44667.1 extracellular solute-binding protein family 1 [Cellulomonas fimi ATCC 484]NNH07479.1 extracellular solute-binding protein [Cellulomonas fimi]VEH26950.1 Lactose-binding protein precursor [Cellulomonas fimi]